MEREERIGINGGLPTMDKNKISIIIVAGLILFPRYIFISFLLPYIYGPVAKMRSERIEGLSTRICRQFA
jgi:hypothetical protein